VPTASLDGETLRTALAAALPGQAAAPVVRVGRAAVPSAPPGDQAAGQPVAGLTAAASALHQAIDRRAGECAGGETQQRRAAQVGVTPSARRAAKTAARPPPEGRAPPETARAIVTASARTHSGEHPGRARTTPTGTSSRQRAVAAHAVGPAQQQVVTLRRARAGLLGQATEDPTVMPLGQATPGAAAAVTVTNDLTATPVGQATPGAAAAVTVTNDLTATPVGQATPGAANAATATNGRPVTGRPGALSPPQRHREPAGSRPEPEPSAGCRSRIRSPRSNSTRKRWPSCGRFPATWPRW